MRQLVVAACGAACAATVADSATAPPATEIMTPRASDLIM
jgi:hypothetical protein